MWGRAARRGAGGLARKSRRMSIGAVRVGALVANTLLCPRVPLRPRTELGVTAPRPRARTHTRTRTHFTPFHVVDCASASIGRWRQHSDVTHAATGGGRLGQRSRRGPPSPATFVTHAILPAIQLPSREEQTRAHICSCIRSSGQTRKRLLSRIKHRDTPSGHKHTLLQYWQIPSPRRARGKNINYFTCIEPRVFLFDMNEI